MDRRCSAHTAASGYKERCKKAPIRGGTVCRVHGGAAPQVQKSAKQRLIEMAEPAARALAHTLAQAIADRNWPAVVRAAVSILDRAGLHPSQTVELTGSVDTGEPTIDLRKLSTPTLRAVIRELEATDGRHPDADPVNGKPTEDEEQWTTIC